MTGAFVPWDIVCLFLIISSCWNWDSAKSAGTIGSITVSGGSYDFVSEIYGMTSEICIAHGHTWTKQSGGSCAINITSDLCIAHGGTWTEDGGGECTIDIANLKDANGQTPGMMTRSSPFASGTVISRSSPDTTAAAIWSLVVTLLGLVAFIAVQVASVCRHQVIKGRRDLEAVTIAVEYKDIVRGADKIGSSDGAKSKGGARDNEPRRLETRSLELLL